MQDQKHEMLWHWPDIEANPMRKQHGKLIIIAVDEYTRLVEQAAEKNSARLHEIASLINQLGMALEEQNQYTDRLIAKGKNLSQLNEALRKRIAELDKEVKRLSI